MQSTLNCGERGQPCCPGNGNDQRCQASLSKLLRCSSDTGPGVCVACGGTGEPCCQRIPSVDPSCAQGNRCTAAVCEACGERGEPCCEGRSNLEFCAPNTLGSPLRCSSDSGQGTCESCGAAGERCCQRTPTDDPSCARGNVCTSSGCRPCGEVGEPCCQRTPTDDPFCIDGECSAGQCSGASAGVRPPVHCLASY